MAAGSATSFRAGEIFFDSGEPVVQVRFLASGVASLTMPVDNGPSVEVLLLGRERAIGLMTANGPVTAFGRVRAEADGAAIVVPSDRFALLVQERASLRHEVNIQIVSLVAQISQGAACNAVHRLQARLATWLLRFHDRLEGGELALTQDHMSRMLGVSRTSMNAVAQAMQADGLVQYTRGRMDIVDRLRLAQVACDCYRRDGRFPGQTA